MHDLGLPDQAQLAERDPEQFLRGGNLIEAGRLRKGAVLMHGRPEALKDVARDYGVVLSTAACPGTEGAVLIGREDSLRRPLILLFDEILTRIATVCRAESIRVGATQFEIVDYPENVVRELVANALAHRDRETAGIVDIKHSPDELPSAVPAGCCLLCMWSGC